jgi:hypothetical protein
VSRREPDRVWLRLTPEASPEEAAAIEKALAEMGLTPAGGAPSAELPAVPPQSTQGRSRRAFVTKF